MEDEKPVEMPSISDIMTTEGIERYIREHGYKREGQSDEQTQAEQA